MVKHIGIVLFADVEELDAIGPWELLSAWTRYFPDDGYTVSCLSRSGGLVQCAKGLVVQAQHSFADAPPLDVLVYPGGQGTRAQLHDDGQLDWVRRQRSTVPLSARLSRYDVRWCSTMPPGICTLASFAAFNTKFTCPSSSSSSSSS